MSKAKAMRVTVTVEPAEIEWSGVMDAVKVESDDSMGGTTPWDNCDGWEHNAEQMRYYDEQYVEDRQRSIRYVSRSSRQGGDVWLTLDIEKSGIGTWEYFHAQGASKQVAHELAANNLRQAYDTLHTWYANGWEWYAVIGELKDCHASLSGIDDLNYATTECRLDIAHELADELEKAGYIIPDRPTVAPYRPQFQRYQHNKRINSFNVSRR